MEDDNPIFRALSPLNRPGPALRAWGLHQTRPSLFVFFFLIINNDFYPIIPPPLSPSQPRFAPRGSLDSFTSSFRPISRGSQASVPQSLHGHHSTRKENRPQFSDSQNGGQRTGPERGSNQDNTNNGGGGAPSRRGTGGQGGSGRGGGSNEGDDSGSDTNHGVGNDDEDESSSSQSRESDAEDRKANDRTDKQEVQKAKRSLWERKTPINDQSSSARSRTGDAENMIEGQGKSYRAHTRHAFKRVSRKTADLIAKGKAKVNGHV